MKNNVVVKNKKAYFNYFVLDTYEAGIVLQGTEIKSIRNGNCNINDSYIRIKNMEAYIINMVIAKYKEGNIFNHEESRERKLLLHKKEIKKILEKSSQENYTVIPLSVYIKNGLVKIEIGLCRGKKIYDKRESIKKKDLERKYYRK